MALSHRKGSIIFIRVMVVTLFGVTYVTGFGVTVTQTGLAISGEGATLRCGYRTQSSTTPAGLVYWNSQDKNNFIRGTAPSRITNTYKPEKYSMRFDEASNAILEITNLGFEDEQEYECHVITEEGSGRSDGFNLVVLVPPSKASIIGISSSVREVVVVEDQPHTLTCTSGSSKPVTSITWSKVDASIDLQLTSSDQYNNASIEHGRLQNTWRDVMFTPYLSHDREDLKCTVTHVALLSEISTRVTLRVMVLPSEMLLKDADSNDILNNTLNVDDGDAMNFECSVVGSSPAASISWTIGQSVGERNTLDAVSMVTNRGDGLLDTVSPVHLVISADQHHNKLLTCEAILRIGSTTKTISRSVTLKVHGPPSEVTISGTDNLVEGTRSSISCSVMNAFPKPRLVWRIDDQDKTGEAVGGDERETIRGRFDITSSLKLDAVRANNGKVVTCSAVHTGVRSGMNHVINDTAILNVRYCPLNISATCPVVLDGSTAQIKCGHVTSNPASDVTILEEGVTVLQTRTIVESMTMTSPVHGFMTEVSYERGFTKDHGPRGFQCCTVPSELCPNEICQLCNVDIQYPPEVYQISNPEILDVTEGDIVNLTCCAYANPCPDGLITWHSPAFHESTCLPQGHSQSIYTTRLSTDHICSVLNFSPVTARDGGTHKCRAKNALPRIYSAPFDIEVKFLPCTSTDESSILENQGSEATLHCDVIANPSPDVTWYFNGESINTSSPRYQVSSSGSGGIQMAISAISAFTDTGNYTCMANNSLGRHSSMVELKIATIPGQPKDLQAPQNGIAETSLLITWVPGYSGGKIQSFGLAYCLAGLMTSSCPTLSHLQNSSFTFAEDTLKPFTLYEIRVWSQNEVGLSEEVSITASTKPLSPSDLGLKISYSPSQGVVTMQFVGGPKTESTIPEDLCIQVQINKGQDWMTSRGCLDVGVVKSVGKDLLDGQLQGVSCGRGLCSKPSAVVVQSNQDIPWIIIIIIIIIASIIGGIITIILIIVLCRYICRKKNRRKKNLKTLCKTVTPNTTAQSPDSWYQPLALPMLKTPSSPPPLPPDRRDDQRKTDEQDDYEALSYERPNQPCVRSFVYDDTSTKTKAFDPEVIYEDGYLPMASFKSGSTHRRAPKPLPKPTHTYANPKGQLYENLRI